MKKFMIIIMFLMSGMCYGQKDFVWEKIDSVPKSKSQIYSETKLFISEKWKSAQSVIQNDDKESGVILVKGVSSQDIYFSLNIHEYKFNYTVGFYMKENKYKISINNVYCFYSYCGNYNWPNVPCYDTYPGYKNTWMNEDRYFELMRNLKKELQSLFDSYITYIATPSSNINDW